MKEYKFYNRHKNRLLYLGISFLILSFLFNDGDSVNVWLFIPSLIILVLASMGDNMPFTGVPTEVFIATAESPHKKQDKEREIKEDKYFYFSIIILVIYAIIVIYKSGLSPYIIDMLN